MHTVRVCADKEIVVTLSAPSLCDGFESLRELPSITLHEDALLLQYIKVIVRLSKHFCGVGGKVLKNRLAEVVFCPHPLPLSCEERGLAHSPFPRREGGWVGR